MSRKMRPDDLMNARDPDDLNLPDITYWSMFGRIRHFLRGKKIDPSTLLISLYPAHCSYSDDIVWTWWAWPSSVESEPETETNYYRAGRFEFYGVTDE